MNRDVTRDASREPVWISRSVALAIHERLVAEHGGPVGIRDEGALDSALAAPRNHYAYGDVDPFVLTGVLAHAVTRNHPFHDGNKRLSLALAGVFLALNGWRLEPSEAAAASMTRALAARDVDSGRRWPAHGSCAGARGMLSLGSRPRPRPPGSLRGSFSRTGQFEFESEEEEIGEGDGDVDAVVASCVSMRRA